MTLIIGIDPGNRYTKAVTADRSIVFPSTVGTGRDSLLRRGSGRENNDQQQGNKQQAAQDITVTLNNKTYFVGHLARESHDASLALDETRANHEFTIILILTAVSLLADLLNNKSPWLNVHAVVGMPIVHFKDRSIRQKLQDRLTCQAHEITVQGVRRVINFERVTPFPEGAAALFSVLSPEFENNRIGIIDAGSWRSNYAVLDCMEYEDKNSNTLTIGMHQALLMVSGNRLLHEVEAAADRNPDLMRELTGARTKKARQLADSVRGKWSDMDFFALYLSGGGAPALKEYFPSAIVMPDAQMANAKGLYQVEVLSSDRTVSRNG